MTTYEAFIDRKSQLGGNHGFDPVFFADELFDFQRSIVEWATLKGRAAILADCGLGKTLMQLTWAENIVRKTNKPVLILTPLSVGAQTVREAEKFGIEAKQSRDGKVVSKITVTNYQQLHKFNWQDFEGVVCDESSILKNFDGQIKAQITDFMRKLKYRLLCTATAAPNDYIELGTSSEALGELAYLDMLKMFFKSESNTYARGGNNGGGMKRFAGKNMFGGAFRFRGHAERDFWRWVCSWARAVRKPSDLGFRDDGYNLPPMDVQEHVIAAKTKNPEYLIDMPAIGLKEQRAERRRTIQERCEKAASLICGTGKPAVAWCHLNPEGNLLEEMIPGAVEVEGSDSDDFKEETFDAFTRGEIRTLISKPVIAGFGLNFQHCAHQTFFPSHSFEQWYQATRRSWRFGQKNTVTIDVISSEGESGVAKNLQRKSDQAEKMFSQLVELMSAELRIQKHNPFTEKQLIPTWL